MRREREHAEDGRIGPAVLGRFDDRVDERDEADDREQRTDGSSAGFEGSRDVGMSTTPAISATITIGMFTRKIEPQ